MQAILKQAKPSCMEDLIALNALYRPGPMDNIPQFIDSKTGKTPITYPDPCLEPILKETYGVIVYQEQVMQVAQRIGGYSLGQADLLRRAMGKKKHEVMVKEKEKFVAGAVANGFKAADADRIFEILIPFAGYGFNKSHAAAYSVVAYRTAYLKANYPAEFMAANLTNEIANTDKLTEYIGEARSMGLEVLPPDVNRSEPHFSVADGKIVYGLLGIKGVGEALARAIASERGKGGTLCLLHRVRRAPGHARSMNKKSLECLASAGCFDSLGNTRREIVLDIERAVEYVAGQGGRGQVRPGEPLRRLGRGGIPALRRQPGRGVPPRRDPADREGAPRLLLLGPSDGRVAQDPGALLRRRPRASRAGQSR